MKLGIIISQNNPETVWNAFRLANLALNKGDTVSIFLTGKGVEYERLSSPKFNIKEQVKKLLDHDSWFDANECVDLGLVDQIYK